jgi:hypothetical protein
MCNIVSGSKERDRVRAFGRKVARRICATERGRE